MLKDLVIIDPERSHTEDDSYKALVLYHEFDNQGGCTLNDKLNKIGIIQGIWSLTESFGKESNLELEKVIELENEIILVILVESRYFICITIADYSGDDDDDPISKDSIPYQFYMNQLWFSYKFFVLIYGEFIKFDDINNLTGALNEHMVTYWNDINLKPETLIRQGIDILWPNAFKISELNTEDLNQEVTDETADESWESIINRNILLQEESYLGIKDILVYHLPPMKNKDPSDKKKNRMGANTFGLVHNFNNDFKNISDFSNWIYHLFCKHDMLSSHILAGNSHYKEIPTTEDSNNNLMNIQQDTNINIQNNRDENNQEPSLGSKILHNLTLPVTFAYDAVQEVGSTTGVSNSISFLKDYVPAWPFKNLTNIRGNNLHNDNVYLRYGYLISPLSLSMLPMNYKVRKLNLCFDGKSDLYNVLFWYYEDTLITIVCDENFECIWDPEYLKDISFILSRSMDKFYKTLDKKAVSKPSNFAYTIIEKSINKPYIRSSIPICLNLFKDEDEDKSPFELVVEGFDQLFSRARNQNDDNKIQGIDIMGSLFVIFNNEEIKDERANLQRNFKQLNNNFLNLMEVDKLWELQREILTFVNSLDNSETDQGINEERLITLNNGVLCYMKNDNNRMVIILKNWFDKSNDDFKYHAKEHTLFSGLGTDVMNWWDNTIGKS